LFAVGVVDQDHAHILELLRREHFFVRRFADGFAGILREHRLRLEALHVAHSAAHEEPDHPFRLRRKKRQAGRRLPLAFHGATFAREHRLQRNAREPSAKPIKKTAAREELLGEGVVAHQR
jgi:hypothetical protein